MQNLLYSTLNIIIDAVALVVLIVYIVLGIKHGFVKTFFKSFGTIIGFIVAALLCSTVANFLESQWGLASTIGGWFKGVLTNLFGDGLMNTSVNDVTADMMQKGGVSAWLVDTVINIAQKNNIPQDVTLSQVICPVVGFYVSCALAFIIVFILTKIILWLVGELVQKLHTIKVIGAVDKILGIVFGIIRAVLLLDIIVMIINSLPISFIHTVALAIPQTYLCNFLVSTNVIGLICDLVVNNGIANMIATLF